MEFLAAHERQEDRKMHEEMVGITGYLSVLGQHDPEKAVKMSQFLMGIENEDDKKPEGNLDLGEVEWIKPTNAHEYQETLQRILTDLGNVDEADEG